MLCAHAPLCVAVAGRFELMKNRSLAGSFTTGNKQIKHFVSNFDCNLLHHSTFERQSNVVMSRKSLNLTWLLVNITQTLMDTFDNTER